MNLPNKAARKHFVYECLRSAGLTHEKALSASRIVPDCINVHALAKGKTSHVMVVDNCHIFIKHGELEPVFLGNLMIDSGYVRAGEFWTDMEFINMTAEEAAAFDFDAALSDYQREKWSVELSALTNPESILTVDIAAPLREFAGV